MLTIDGIQYPNASVTILTNQPSVPPVIPPVPPVIPPVVPPVTPPAGVILNPLTVNPAPAGTIPGAPFDIKQARTYVFDCPANAIHSFSIVFDSATFGAGAALTTNQIVENPNRRNMWISETPGGSPIDPTHWGNRNTEAQASAENLVIYVRFDFPAFGSVFAQKDTPYYLNVKPAYPGEPIRYLLQPYPTA